MSIQTQTYHNKVNKNEEYRDDNEYKNYNSYNNYNNKEIYYVINYYNINYIY